MARCDLGWDDHRALGRVERKGAQQRRERLGNTEMRRGVGQRGGRQVQER